MTVTRNIFYISDRTGLTAENIGEALLNQFSNIEFKRATYPFIDTAEKARSVVDIVNRAAESQGRRPIAFVSVVNNEIRQIIKEANAFQINFFDTFLGELEKELDVEATTAHHGHHGIGNTQRYDARMEAVNFSLNHDDGVSDKNLKEADVILMGVSRSGKTPTCRAWSNPTKTSCSASPSSPNASRPSVRNAAPTRLIPKSTPAAAKSPMRKACSSATAFRLPTRPTNRWKNWPYIFCRRAN